MINGDLLKEKRIEKGLTQEELGKLVGVSKVTIHSYEKNKKTPSLKHLVIICKKLDMKIDDVIK